MLAMVRVTMYGPTRRTPFSRAMSAATTTLAVEAPPEPITRPVRSLETSPGSRPASSTAWRMAM